MVEHGEFLEHAEVFDNYYGTGRDHVQTLRADGSPVLLEIDWQGARQVRSKLPEAVSVFILPPRIAELERRLRGRATDSEEVIARRLGDALSDIAHWREADYVVINGDLDTAVDQFESIVLGRPQAVAVGDPGLEARIGTLFPDSAET